MPIAPVLLKVDDSTRRLLFTTSIPASTALDILEFWTRMNPPVPAVVAPIPDPEIPASSEPKIVESITRRFPPNPFTPVVSIPLSPD